MDLQTQVQQQITQLQSQMSAGGTPDQQATLANLNSWYQKLLQNGGVISDTDQLALEAMLDDNEKTVLASAAAGTETIIGIALIAMIVIGIAAALIFKHHSKV